jgi:predicted extracellular nuclease
MRIQSLSALAVLLAACGGGGGVADDPAPPPPGGPTTISEVQGTGATSPFVNQTVTVTGIVTGDFQEDDADTRRNLRGFYLQGVADGNVQTSDGIFIFDGNNPSMDVDVGDAVEVRGTINEYFGETQINASSVRVTGTGSVLPIAIDLPYPTTTANSAGERIADLERLEGMLVQFNDTLTVTDLWTLGRFGEVTLSEGGRLFQFTNDNAPDVAGYAVHWDEIARRVIILDDGLRTENPSQIHYLNAGSAAGYSIRLGDTLTGLVGNLRYSRGADGNGAEGWRLEPTSDPVFQSANPRPVTPGVDGALLVAGMNVLNFFTTIDQGQNNCGPGGGAACRGADSNAELTRQREKLVSAMLRSGADIFGLTELQNNSTGSLRALVDAINSREGGNDFAYIDSGVIHTDVIKAGIIYRRSVVTPVGNFVLLDRSVDSRYNDDRNRPSLAQAFSANANGARLSVVVSHLKSKVSSCDADGDPNTGDGQGNCNLTRVNAAAALVDWVASDPTGSGDPDYLLVGDMNAYYLEDPIDVFRNGGLVDLLAGAAKPYSYLFQAQSGAYDYAFATAGLATQVRAAAEWHINVDEPPVLDYNLEYGRDPALFDASQPYRSSDHDPVIIGLDPTN